jgi:hypothetical protein
MRLWDNTSFSTSWVELVNRPDTAGRFFSGCEDGSCVVLGLLSRDDTLTAVPPHLPALHLLREEPGPHRPLITAVTGIPVRF